MSHAGLPSSVGIVGLGRVGSFLARCLQARGVTVRGWDVAGGASIQALAAQGVQVTIGDGLDGASGVPLLLLAVPDRRIEPVGACLGPRPWLPGAVVLHTSGFLPAAALRPHLPVEVAVGSLHPVHAFVPGAAPDPRGLPAGIEGEAAAVTAAWRLALALGLRPFPVAPQQKELYHAALALLANGTVGLFAAAREVLGRAGVPEEDAQDLLAHLLASTATNLQALPPSRALTGPVQRGDCAVVSAHRAAVAREIPAESQLLEAVVARLQRLVTEGRP